MFCRCDPLSVDSFLGSCVSSPIPLGPWAEGLGDLSLAGLLADSARTCSYFTSNQPPPAHRYHHVIDEHMVGLVDDLIVLLLL